MFSIAMERKNLIPLCARGRYPRRRGIFLLRPNCGEFFYMRKVRIKKTRVAKWQGGKPTCLKEGYLFFIEQAGLPLCHLARPPKRKNLIPLCARWRPTPESLDFRKIACARLYETDVRRERSVPPWWYPRRGGAPPTPAWTVVTRDEKRWNLCFLSDRLSKLRQ